MTPFSTLLANRRIDNDTVTYAVSDDWGQGRTMFGGLQSALAVQAIKDTVGKAWPPEAALRALQTNFLAPVAAGEILVRARALREGKNIRQVQALLEQAGAVVAMVVGIFGLPKDSQVPSRWPEPTPLKRDVAASMEMPFFPGLSPNFIQHLSQRWARGGLPYTGTASWELSLYLQLRDEDVAGVPTDLLAVLLADAGPTPVLAQLKQPAPASTVSWALELLPLDDAFRQAGNTWWRLDKANPAFAGGYAHEQGHLWTPDGQLAALGYQVVAVYG